MAHSNLYQIDGLKPAQMIHTNGITLGVFCAGPVDGEVVVMCHGFPELAFTWRHQIAALSNAGYRVLAPDMRGFGHSDQPANISHYTVKTLCADMAGMLDHFDIDNAVFVGHDWGGVVTWQMPLFHPQRVRGLVGINTPFIPRHPRNSLLDAYRRKFGENMYILQFQEPGVADQALARDAKATLQFFMRKSQFTAAEFEQAPPHVRELNFLHALEHGEPKKWAQNGILTDEELNVFASAYAHTGFTGGINWYRNFQLNWEQSKDLVQRVPQRSLMIMAENDVVLPPSTADGMETYVPDLTRHLVKDCGHWTQQEHPDEVNRVMLDWLAGFNQT